MTSAGGYDGAMFDSQNLPRFEATTPATIECRNTMTVLSTGAPKPLSREVSVLQSTPDGQLTLTTL